MSRGTNSPDWQTMVSNKFVNSLVCDLFPSSKFYAEDLASPALELTDALTFKPATMGLPEPDPDRLDRMLVRSSSITADDAIPDHK